MNRDSINRRPGGDHGLNANSSHCGHPLVLKSGEAAKALGICPRKLWELTDQGKIPHVRIGSSVRYPVDALKKWLDGQLQGGEGAATGVEESTPATGGFGRQNGGAAD